MLEPLLFTQKPLSRLGYFFCCLVTILIGSGFSKIAFEIFGEGHDTFPLACFIAIVCLISATGVILLLSLRRQQETHWHPVATLCLFIPGINLLYITLLACARRKP